MNQPVESSDERKRAWCVSDTSSVMQKLGPDGKTYQVVEATLVVELTDYTDIPF